MENLNLSIFDMVNGLAGHSRVLDTLMVFAASDLVFITVVAMVLLWFWPGYHVGRAARQRLGLSATLVTCAALGSGLTLGAIHYEARPFVLLASAHLLVEHVADNGFPSDHATIAFSVAGALFWWKRRYGILLISVGVLLGFARVYVGVHLPNQVVAGAAIGFLVGSVAVLIAPWWVGPQRLATHVFPSWIVSAP